MQTAVEWLIEQLIPEDQHEGIMDIIEDAKEREQGQICLAFLEGQHHVEKLPSQYYIDTYGSKGSGNTPKCTCNVDPFLCQIHGTSDGKTITAF